MYHWLFTEWNETCRIVRDAGAAVLWCSLVSGRGPATALRLRGSSQPRLTMSWARLGYRVQTHSLLMSSYLLMPLLIRILFLVPFPPGSPNTYRTLVWFFLGAFAFVWVRWDASMLYVHFGHRKYWIVSLTDSSNPVLNFISTLSHPIRTICNNEVNIYKILFDDIYVWLFEKTP